MISLIDGNWHFYEPTTKYLELHKREKVIKEKRQIYFEVSHENH